MTDARSPAARRRRAVVERPEAYIARDRRRALAEGTELPDRVHGAALFADISGFTHVTEMLASELGAQRGAEELAAGLDRVFEEMIAELDRLGGDVIYFSGDAVTCWLDGDDGVRAVACGLAMQDAVDRTGEFVTPAGTVVRLALKVSVVVGPARRFVVGDPDIQFIEVLAGTLVDELATVERHAAAGEVVLGPSARRSLEDRVEVIERPLDDGSGGSVGVLTALLAPADDVAAATDPEQPLTVELVRPWLLPAVYERLRTGQGELFADLRPAIPVFVRFGGIEYDVEPAAPAKLDHFVRCAQRVLTGFGGNLLQLTLGDKGAYLYAIFGSPHAHEDDAARAVAAALELRALEGVTAVSEIQVGITTGRVLSGTFGHPMRRTFTCLGDAVNLAARLMSHAPPSGVYVGATVQAQAGDAFQWQRLPAIRVKGKAEPVTVYSLTGTVTTHGPRRQKRYLLELVGREAELDVLAAAMETALDGRGQAVGIAAEAGMGKSRLVAEFVRAARAAGRLVAFGECPAFGDASYAVWCEIWHTILGIDDRLPPDVRLATLDTRLAAIDEVLPARAPLLAPLLNMSMPDNDLTRTLEPKLRKSSLEDLLTSCLRATAAEGPLVVVLEDCHWIDALSRDLLEVLVRAVATLPVLVVLDYRPTVEPGGDLGLAGLADFTEIGLGDLTPVDAERLIRSKVGQLFGEDVEPPDALVQLVTARSQGNPFYVEELLNYLHGEGVDLRNAASLREVVAPESLHSLILSRIDVLEESPRRVLKVASVVGRSFLASSLPGVYAELGTIDDVRTDLRALRAADLVTLDREADESYLFKHVVTAEVTYENLPFATRAMLHERVGAYIEATNADSLEQQLDLLAHHYWRGNDDDKKREYLVRAGRAAQTSYANAAAIDYFERAVPLLSERERVDALLDLGAVIELTGDWSRAEDGLRQALDLATGLDDAHARARCQAALAEAARRQGRFDEAAHLLAEAGAAFTAAGDDAGVGRVHHLAGTLAAQQGDYDQAVARYQASLAIRESLDDRASIAALLSNLGVVAEYRGDYASAREHHERALALREEVGDRRAIAVSLTNLGAIAVHTGDFELARASFEHAMRLNREVGDAWMVANNENDLGNASRGLGDLAAARRHYALSLRGYRDYDDAWALAFLLEDIARLAALSAEPELALELIGAADTLRSEIGAARAPALEQELEEAMADATAALGDDVCRVGRRRGRELERAAAFARGLASASVPRRSNLPRVCQPRGRGDMRISRPRRSRLRRDIAVLSAIVIAAVVPVGASPTALAAAPSAGAGERAAPALAPPTVITIDAEADTFVSASAPGTNFGAADNFDTYGGFTASCVPLSAPAYGLLRFDLSAIPDGAVISGARIVATTRAGYAQDGDGNHHAIVLEDDSWSEEGVTWNTRPSDGTVAPGDPALVSGGDIRSSPRAVGSAFTFRATCNTDFAANHVKVFPTNDVDEAKSFADSRLDLIGSVANERVGDGKLSIELYNPNCPLCHGNTDLGYWARYWSREASDPAVRPYLEVTLGADNDVWTRAQSIGLDGSGNGSATGSIDVTGQARWYRFPIQPGTRARVDLTNVPANYDVAVFTDIAQAFGQVETTSDLQRLSAEFAADAFSPSVFSPSVFSPSVFSPSVFSPSVFSPSVFSPSVFSPSVFSPSVFSPSVFSPSVFSPSVFSPSVFSPSVFSDGQAYESAQVRSLLAVSANDGTAEEHLAVDTWSNTGSFYVRVAGRNGAHSPGSEFALGVHVDPSACTGVGPSSAALLSAPVPTGVQTLILADHGRMVGDLTTMQARLGTFATAVGGRIVDVGAASPRVAALNAQADARTSCPFAKNLVADAIRDIVLAYRAVNPSLAYIVVIGSDAAIPFFRYPDIAGLGPESGYVPPVADASASQASLRLNYYLSQDAYGATTEVQSKGVSLPVPDLPVGRLVETPAEITGMLDAYLARPVLRPTRSLVTGYDFLTDGAASVQSSFSAGLGGTGADALITNQDVDPSDVGPPPLRSWTADQLRSNLFGSRHDLVYLAGHFSANNLLAADYTSTVNATELTASSVDLANAVVLSAGCHSGYTVVDGDVVPNVTQALDWIQAFAQKRATVIGGTGYQYGDTDFLEYSERLFKNVAEAFRVGAGPVGVGDALVSAKQRYLADTPTLGGIHQKALLEATLYGLPMSGVELPTGRDFVPPTGPPVVTATSPVGTDPGSTLGLSVADVTRSPTLTPASRPMLNGNGAPSGVTATWFSGPNGVVTNPGAPALPLAIDDVGVAGKVLRGVGFRGGTFSDTAGVTPLTGAPATELNTPHSSFASAAFYPSRLWGVNYFDGLANGNSGTRLMVTPVQYRSDAPGSATNVQRRFTSTSLRLFYSDYTDSFGASSAALAAPPTIARVDADVVGSDVSFRVRAVGEPAAGMQQVWVTYTGGTPGAWRSLDLTQDPVDSTSWTGTLTGVAPDQVQFLVQAVNGVGLVGLDDNQGAYYRPGQISAALTATPLPATSVALEAPASGTYGAMVTLRGRLTADGAPLADARLKFSVGGSEAVGVTDSNGTATARVPALATPGNVVATVAFDGSTTHAASSATRPFAVGKLATTLALASSAPPTVGGDTGVVATLTTTAGAPVPDHTVLFRLAPAGGAPIVVARVTGVGGKVQLGTVTPPDGKPLGPGTYTVQAYFGPNAALGFAVAPDAIYAPSAAALGAPVVVERKILFTSTRSGNGDIYSVGPTGGTPVQLTTGPGVDAEPDWSPRGDKIVFTSTRSGNSEIFVMDSDGTRVTQLTTNTALDASPAWSPNGQKIAFTSNRGAGGNLDVYVMNADGSGVQRLTTDGQQDLFPAWSPDSGRIAFMSTRSGNGDIYTMNANGSSQTRRTTSNGIDSEPAWGTTRIAFSTNRDGATNSEIYTMTDTGGSQTRVTNQPGLDTSPAWSSDGGRLAFASTRSPGSLLNVNIHTMAANGTGVTPIVTHSSADISPDW